MDAPVGDNKRLLPLDGLRGVAILLVVAFHYLARFADEQMYPYGAAFAGFVPARDGFVGVYLFFLVSGFVIFRSLRQSKGLLDFGIKRANRLVLPMLVLSSLTLAVFLLIPDPHFDVRVSGLLPSWTFTTPGLWRWADPEVSYIDGVYWTLFVEVRFYALMALLWFCLPERFAVPVFALIAFAASVAGHFVDGAAQYLLNLTLFPAFIPLFACGVIYAEIYREGLRWPYAGALTLLIPTSVISLSLPTGEGGGWAVAFWVLGFHGLLLALALRSRTMQLFAFRPLVFVGSVSYSLYLLHQRLGVEIIARLPEGWSVGAYLVAVLAVTGGMIAAAYWSWRLLETRKPFNRLKPAD